METKLCRICGKLGKNFADIFKTEGLRHKIETCLPIIVSPHCLLPDTICSDCTETVENFYDFTKNCLQNVIILESQYNITESCLKSKRKKEKSCSVDFNHVKDSKSAQTDDYLDVLTGKSCDFSTYSSDFPLTSNFLETAPKAKPTVSLVEYDVDSDSNSDENNPNDGKVVLGERLQILNRIEGFVDNILSRKRFAAKKSYFDDAENDLISEISQRKSLKRKGDVIESRAPKIFRMDSGSRRKSKQPKKIEPNSYLFGIPPENGTVQMEHASDYNEEAQSQLMQTDKPFSILPQNCLLCDTNFSGPAALAAHVFETHGIDMAEVVSSSNSAESVPDKAKKRIPNLVKISDLRRADANAEGNRSPEESSPAEEPPTLEASFVCSSCPAVFTSRPELAAHAQRRHARQAALLCGVCARQCRSPAELRAHAASCAAPPSQSRRPLYACRVCGRPDDSAKRAESHVLVHDFLLDECKRRAQMFDPADYVEAGERADGDEPAGPRCAECDSEPFDDFKEFSAHRRSQHSIFHCDLCNKFYGRNSHLWKHVNRLHKGHPSITCQLCYKTSASKYHLSQHFNKIHLAKGTKKGSSDAAASWEDKEDFMSQKFQAFDFQSVKQSFMRQEMEDSKKLSDGGWEAKQSSKNDSKAAAAAAETDRDDSKQDYFDEADESCLQFAEREAAVKASETKAEPKESNHSVALEAPKEIDSSHDLYTNIITNYTPPANEGEFKCPKCSKAFHKKVLLKKHKKNCRPKLQKDLLTRCKSCARIFKDRQSLAKHLVNYHSEYACEICAEKVQSKCEIVSHIRFRHPGCHLFCKACGNILRSRDDLEEHQVDHGESYVCQFCGDSLPSKIKLKMHILSLHRKILSLSCGICLKLFETQHVLRDHVALVHGDQLAPLTSCPVCGKNYGSKWKTYDHLNKSHGRIFRACKTCLEVFDTQEQLAKHCESTGHGSTVAAASNAVRNNANAVGLNATGANLNAAHAVNIKSEVMIKNEAEDSDVDEEQDEDVDNQSNEESNEEYEDDLEENGSGFKEAQPDNKISLLEKRLLGKKVESSAFAIEDKVGKANNFKKEVKTKVSSEDFDNYNSVYSPNSTANVLNVSSSKRTVYVNSNDPSYCEICFKNWPAKKHLWQHYIRCHKSVAATVCGICLKTNDSYKSLQLHLQTTHPTLLHGQGFGSNFICRICGRYHNASSKLRLHMVIHENFDWDLINEKDPDLIGERADEEESSNVDSNVEAARNGYQVKVEPENNSEDINYESLIEQVECSSQSDISIKDEREIDVSSGSEENGNGHRTEDDSESEEDNSMLDSSMQQEMLQMMMKEKEKFGKNVEEVCSSSEESMLSFGDNGVDNENDNGDENEEEVETVVDIKSETSDEEEDDEDCSNDSNSSGSDVVESSELKNDIFRREPEELDSAIKSISYECVETVDVDNEDIYCEMQSNCLNENEIESAVGSIL